MKTVLYFFIFLVFQTSFVDATDQPPDGSSLVGFSSKEELAKRISDVIIGKFASLGHELADSGAITMNDASVDIQSSLKGKISGSAAVYYRISADPKRGTQKPQLGTLYIMFIQTHGKETGELIKILPATPENISRIKGLIAHTTPGT